MKLILVMVTTLDGKSTRGKETNNHTWTSPEDQKHFQQILQTAKLIIMGSGTYEPAKNTMEHRTDLLRVVITRDPNKYESEKIPGKLEFTNESPASLIKRLESKGFAEGYLVGGAHTNTEFLKQGIVTELWQTLEPKILGVGNGIVGEEAVDITLKLLSTERMNEHGTLLLKYEVI